MFCKSFNTSCFSSLCPKYIWRALEDVSCSFSFLQKRFRVAFSFMCDHRTFSFVSWQHQSKEFVVWNDLLICKPSKNLFEPTDQWSSGQLQPFYQLLRASVRKWKLCGSNLGLNLDIEPRLGIQVLTQVWNQIWSRFEPTSSLWARTFIMIVQFSLSTSKFVCFLLYVWKDVFIQFVAVKKCNFSCISIFYLF